MFIGFDKPLIVGILNITPDSFSDGGHYLQPDKALEHVLQMHAQGADMIDIGGESTRPGAEPVPADEQIKRVIPVITEIRRHSPILLSIDTRLSEVAEAALNAGANVINDVSAGRHDSAILRVAALAQVPIVLMHSRETPKTMQDHPFYEDVLHEVITELRERINAALDAGVRPDHIVLDPGIGFAKRKQDNLVLLAGLEQLTALGYPVLLGTSRKRFMGSICPVNEPGELVTATAVTTALGVMAGVKLFRVHDIVQNRHAADVAWAIKHCQD